MTARLKCCRPIAYAPGSGHLVHSMTCPDGPERSLTGAEVRELRDRDEHPAGSARRQDDPPLPSVRDIRRGWGYEDESPWDDL